MTQYDEEVDYQRTVLRAENWAKGIKTIHSHGLKSMWYDNRPQDTDESMVRDIQYNDGSIKRTILKTGQEVWFSDEKLSGDRLVDAYLQRGK